MKLGDTFVECSVFYVIYFSWNLIFNHRTLTFSFIQRWEPKTFDNKKVRFEKWYILEHEQIIRYHYGGTFCKMKHSLEIVTYSNKTRYIHKVSLKRFLIRVRNDLKSFIMKKRIQFVKLIPLSAHINIFDELYDYIWKHVFWAKKWDIWWRLRFCHHLLITHILLDELRKLAFFWSCLIEHFMWRPICSSFWWLQFVGSLFSWLQKVEVLSLKAMCSWPETLVICNRSRTTDSNLPTFALKRPTFAGSENFFSRVYIHILGH